MDKHELEKLNEELKRTVVHTPGAGVLMNKEFIEIGTRSGYGYPSHTDYKGASHVLPLDTDNQTLGELLLDACSRSRFVLGTPRNDGIWIHPDVTYDMDLYDLKKLEQRDKEWVAQIMAKYGYKTRRAMFKDMAYCFIAIHDGLINMRPLHHVKIEAWDGEGLTEADNVVIPFDSPPSEIGAALRLALSRCT